MDHDQDTGQDPPDSAEQLPADPHDSDSQNGVTDPSPPLPAAAAATPAAAPTGRRSRGVRAGTGAAPERAPGRARGKAGDIPERFDAGAPGAPKWSSHDADILWPEMIEWLQRKGRSPYDVTVNVIRVEPPPRSSVGEGFEANAAVGDGSSLTPGDAIKRIVEDYYHLPVSRTPAKYELQFVWRANSQYIAQGYLSCASPAEIIALRNAQHARRMQQPTQQMPGLGGYSPPQQQQIPPFVPQGYGVGAPIGYPPFYQQPPQQAPQLPVREQLELERLRADNERLRREQQAPPRAPQPGFGAPSPMSEAEREERLVTRVVTALRAAGLGAPAAPPPPPNDMISGMRSALAVMREFRRFSEDAAGVFEPDDPPPRQLATGTGNPPPQYEPDDPYETTEFPTPWGDGTKPTLKRDRETGKIDLIATAFANPGPTQKLMNASAAFIESMARRRGLGSPPPEEEGIPEEQPQFQQQQQQQLPPAQEQPQSDAPPTGSDYDNL